MKRRIDLNDTRLLMYVVEHGSYTAAARATGIPKSTISQRIAALEATVGTGLLRRTSRSFSLTEAGQLLLPHARAFDELAQKVELSLLERGEALQGTLRISCSQTIAQFALSPVLPRFLAKHEHATVRLEASNRIVDLVTEGYDMAIRGHVGLLKDSTMIQRVVAHTPWLFAASSEWASRHGLPATPDDLPGTQALIFATHEFSDVWAMNRDGEKRLVKVTPRLILNDLISLQASVVAGGGMACLPAYLIKSDLQTGQLVRLLPEWWGPTSTISVLTPPKAQSSRLARAFSQFLAAELPSIMQPLLP